MKCKHNFVRSGYGDDLICTKCGQAAMQASIRTSLFELSAVPILIEEMEVPVIHDCKVKRVSVSKDNFKKELSKSLGLDINHHFMQSNRR
jgi:hypothetical protein